MTFESKLHKNTKAQPREESGSYSTESSYQFKYLDRPANDPITLDCLPVNTPASLHVLEGIRFDLFHCSGEFAAELTFFSSNSSECGGQR